MMEVIQTARSWSMASLSIDQNTNANDYDLAMAA